MDKTRDKIYQSYIDYVLENKKRPKSVHAFVEELKIKEGTFFKYFKSFEQLEKSFWLTVFEQTLERVQSQGEYQAYSINEKLLALYYTWIEELQDYRSYAKYVLNHERIYELYPSEFNLFKDKFEELCTDLISEGIGTEEIANRMFVTDKYKYLLWYQPVSIIKFWVKDESENFENTDALIEKTVNFSFDLMRSNGVDSFFDLAKFHIQHF